MNYTSIEQSIHLEKLGLDIMTADMFYNEPVDETYPKDIVDTEYPMVIRENQKYHLLEYGTPCWSVGALLDIIWKIEYCQPKIYYTDDTDDDFKPFVGYWGELTIMEEPFDCYETKKGNLNEGKLHESPIGALYEMVCWLLENGYIEKSWEKQ